MHGISRSIYACPYKLAKAGILWFVAILNINYQLCRACTCPYVTMTEQLCYSDWLAVVTVDVDADALQLVARSIADIEVGVNNKEFTIPLSGTTDVTDCDLGPDDFIDGGTYVLAGKTGENGTFVLNLCYYHTLWSDLNRGEQEMFLNWNSNDYNELCKDNCPPGCLEYFDGCNTCGCTFEGDMFDCTTAECKKDQLVEPMCTCSATEPPPVCDLECPGGYTVDVRGCTTCECIPFNVAPERYCPVNCEVYSDGCYTCVCDRQGLNPICDTTECVETGAPHCLCEYAEAKCEPSERTCMVHKRDEKGCETCECDMYLSSANTTQGELTTQVNVCPENCDIFFDGCNFCICGALAGCTLKVCTVYEETDPFCVDEYAANEPDAPLYITPDDNDAVNCPIFLCSITCEYGYQQTADECNLCACRPRPDCPELDCPACDTFRILDNEGCESCECYVHKCPKGCHQYSDGCNTYLCVENASMQKETNITCGIDEYKAAACLAGDDVEIPQNCSRWFDGCNQCKVDVDGTLLTCSSRQCSMLRDAQCVLYYSDDGQVFPDSVGNSRVDGEIVEMGDGNEVGLGRYPPANKADAIPPVVEYN